MRFDLWENFCNCKLGRECYTKITQSRLRDVLTMWDVWQYSALIEETVKKSWMDVREWTKQYWERFNKLYYQEWIVNPCDMEKALYW